jgi:uncharacterized membrane protein YraQ (UPF0718 family)
MVWLSDLVFSLLENIFQLDSQSTLFGILHFFIYDTIKIFILLSFLIFLVSYIQSYFPPERTTKILGRFKGITGNILGALLGTITPFCSCSSIPIFIGFTRAGLPLGVTFSFLISSPLVDLASFLILMSFLGPQIAIAYVIVGLILAVLGGLIIDKAKMEDYLQDYVIEMRKQGNTNDLVILEMTKKERVKFSFDQVLDIIKRVWLYVLIGVGIGSTIHNVIPEDVIGYILGGNNPFNVLIASVVGIPMYADIFGTIPIAEALLGKGVGIGTILAFMMSVTALSLPSMVMLSKVVKKRLLFTFIGIVSFGIIIIGYLFNILEFIV